MIPETSSISSGLHTQLSIPALDGSVIARTAVYPDADDAGGYISPVQTHSCNVAIVVDGNESLEETDAIITSTPGLGIAIRTADCVPLLLFASDIKAVAAVHAGWKGSLGGIVEKTVDILIEEGAEPEYLHAVFGPSICCGCYEVDHSLAELFQKAGFEDCISYPCVNSEKQESDSRIILKPHIDLQKVNIRRLMNRDIPQYCIHPSSVCTRHYQSAPETYPFPSWRRDKSTSKRLLSTIRLEYPL